VQKGELKNPQALLAIICDQSCTSCSSRKASARTGAKAGRRFSEKKNPQASCEETEIVAFSESDAVPANHKKKRRDQFMAASKSGLDVPD